MERSVVASTHDDGRIVSYCEESQTGGEGGGHLIVELL